MLFAALAPFVLLLSRVRITGREHIPEGGVSPAGGHRDPKPGIGYVARDPNPSREANTQAALRIADAIKALAP